MPSVKLSQEAIEFFKNRIVDYSGARRSHERFMAEQKIREATYKQELNNQPTKVTS